MYKIFYLVIIFLFPFQLASAGSSSAGWKMECSFSHSSPDDPIVSTAPGASHMHDFMGNLKANAKSTYNSMLTGGTSCGIPEDTAGYWTPALYKNGVKINPSTTHIYYRRDGTGNVTAFPADFRMIAGNHLAASPTRSAKKLCHRIARPAKFRCTSGFRRAGMASTSTRWTIRATSPIRVAGNVQLAIRSSCPASYSAGNSP
jgi:Domain of unknown function (DUF1996)